MDKYQHSQKNKLFKHAAHDPYCLPKVEGSAICPQCDAVYQAGNWTWNHPENTLVPNAQSVTCPACRRIADNAAAGTLTVSGSFWPQHRGEIVHLFEHIEKREEAEHALERIIHLTDTADELTVTTTGVHLANCLGHALEAAYKGQAHYHYDDNQCSVTIRWAREQ